MTSFHHIQKILREELSDLCAACDYEHAILEEGPDFEQPSPGASQSDLREAA